MKKVLLDYDNTICDFNKIMIEKWKVLPDLYQKYPFKYEDINLYSLQKCLQNLGYPEDVSYKLISDFWKVENLYQDFYFDMLCRSQIITLIKNLKANNYFIEMNTLCNSLEMANSKIIRMKKDAELFELVDNFIINIMPEKYKFEKPIDYDIIIEDNPIYIERYLKENENGLVYMPLWTYNKYLLPNNHIEVIENA